MSNTKKLMKIGVSSAKAEGGFTLIELLVVISLIGLLASIVLINLSDARKKGRDAKRIADIKQIQKALEMYIDKHGTLPQPSGYGRRNVSPSYWDGWWDLSSNSTSTFMNFLVTDGILTKVPVDPLNTPANFNGSPTAAGYRYIYFAVPKTWQQPPNLISCSYNVQNVYMLAITDLETDSHSGRNPPAKFSDSRCDCLWSAGTGGANYFQNVFDYVTCGSY